MKCPRCNYDQQDNGIECAKCGIVFAKYLTKQKASFGGANIGSETVLPAMTNEETDEPGGSWNELFFYVSPETSYFYLIGRAFLLLVMIAWGLKFIFSSPATNYAGESFLHLINLPFHEAGHIFFRVFGQFMMMLGGSLTQLLVPLVCLLTFIFKTRDTFAASVSLWWLGENFIDLAPYVNDARELKLILLGGVTGRDVADYHDWEFILRKLGWLQYDHALAGLADLMGKALMICSIVWGGFLLIKQYKYRSSDVA